MINRLLVLLLLYQISICGLLLDDTIGESLTLTQMQYLFLGNRPIKPGNVLPSISAIKLNGKEANLGSFREDACLVFTSCNCQIPRAIQFVGNLKVINEHGELFTRFGAENIYIGSRWETFKMRDSELFTLMRGYRMPVIVHVLKNGRVISIAELGNFTH